MAEGEVRAELLAAGERVFAARGYAGATVDDVVRSSGRSRASFYRYFAGKEELYEELSRACFREMGAVVADLGRLCSTAWPARHELAAVLERYRELNDRYGGVIRAWTELTGPAEAPMHERGRAAVRAMLDEAAGALGAGGERALRTRAALLFLLVERSHVYVSSRVSRIEASRLTPTLTTLVERACRAGPRRARRSPRVTAEGGPSDGGDGGPGLRVGTAAP